MRSTEGRGGPHTAGAPETTLLNETALAEDWNRPEEDEAWSHLSQVP